MRPSTSARPALAIALLLAAPVAAQLDDRRPALVERVVRLDGRPAPAAIEALCPLLSARGSVEVRDNGRELVVRDVEAVVDRALRVLAAGDRAARPLRIAVQIVRADLRAPAAAAGAGAGGPASTAALDLPAEVVARLHRLLRYRSFSVLARADIEAAREEELAFDVGTEFRVSFRLERAGAPERLRMREFRVLRKDWRGELEPLVHTHLSLELGRPMILGLAPTEASERALMVILEAAG